MDSVAISNKILTVIKILALICEGCLQEFEWIKGLFLNILSKGLKLAGNAVLISIIICLFY